MNKPTSHQDHARYIRISHWLRRRYTVNGALVTYRGKYPTDYTRREIMAFSRYVTTTNPPANR